MSEAFTRGVQMPPFGGKLLRSSKAVAVFAITLMASRAAAEGGSEAWTPATPANYAAAYLVFLFAWRAAPGSLGKGFVLGAWVLGATSMIPAACGVFFETANTGDPRGVLAWLGVAGINGLAAACAEGLARVTVGRHSQRRAAFLGVTAALCVTALPPVGFVGMAVPLIAAGAFFPGFGAAGYLLLVGLSGWIVCARAAPLLRPLMTALFTLIGVEAVAHLMQAGHPARALPFLAEGRKVVLRSERPPVSGGSAWFDYQDQMKSEALESLTRGAKLVVLPEGAVSLWDTGSVSYWTDVAGVARERGAHVLIGAYSRDENQSAVAGGVQPMKNTLIDLTTGQQYAARATLPVGMWRPWARDGDTYPLSLSGGDGTLSVGGWNALFVVCYEEVLLWPLTLASLKATHPQMIISAASNWYFARDEWRSQYRVIALQARLFDLPLVRAVSYGPATATR